MNYSRMAGIVQNCSLQFSKIIDIRVGKTFSKYF